MMEFAALFFPLLQIYKLSGWQPLKSSSSDKQHQGDLTNTISVIGSRDTEPERSPSHVWSESSCSLEEALESRELFAFAATRDFTAGEYLPQSPLQAHN